jgi:polyhydroxyalkanoate synthesis regulator phasin
MSGQPVRTLLDQNAFRKAYMANLQLQMLNDDINLQANKAYTKTGVVSTIEDTRTTSEKLNDLYRLRVEIRNKLNSIMDGDNAQRVAESLDTNEAQFLAQQINTIIADLKPKYALGVPAEIFIPYLQKFMQKTSETQGVEFGLQQETGRQLVAGLDTILSTMPTGAELNDISAKVTQLGLQNTALGRELNVNIKNISEVLDYLPEVFNSINEANNSILKTQVLRDLNGLIKELPSRDLLQRLLADLERALQRRDGASSERIMGEITQSTGYAGDLEEEIQALRQQVLQLKGARLKEDIPEAMPVTPSGAFGFVTYKDESITYIPPNRLEGLKKRDLQNYIEAMRSINPNLVGRGGLNMTKTQVSTTLSKPKLIEDLTEKDDVVRSIWSETVPQASVVSGRGMCGRGLSNKKINIKIDSSVGIPESNPYVQFGKYYINKHKLNDGVIMIKRKSGDKVGQIETQRLSPNLLVVFKKLSGGSIPSFAEMERLDDDERSYLKKIARKSNLTDKLDVPSPKKDKNEELMNKFNIMKGSIIAGNNSRDLLKNFKKVIVEMVEEGILPKNQARDLLIELAKME